MAVIGAGRIVAIDTPAGLVSRNAPTQTIRFRSSTPFDDVLLTSLSEVTSMHRTGSRIEVNGTGDLLQAVTAALARHRIVAEDLRIEQANLDDAYVALTGRLHPDADEGVLVSRRS